MENITRTVFAAYQQTCLFLNVPVSYPANTTLNEKLSINAGVLPSASDRPSLSAYVIGYKGHSYTQGADGTPLPDAIQHQATDAALYGQIPFVLRELNNDLSQTDRAKYALRLETTFNSTRYAAYYARRLDKTNTVPQMQTVQVTAGVAGDPVPFVPNSSNLNPTPPDITSTGVNTTDGTYVQASATISLSLSQEEMQELINVAKVMFNDERYAIISEIGLVSGVDKVVAITSTAGNFNMNEIIGCTIMAHAPTMITGAQAPNGADITLNVGSTEPLFSLSH